MDTSKLKGLWEKIKDFFKNMSKKLRIILAAALAVILIAIIVLAVVLVILSAALPAFLFSCHFRFLLRVSYSNRKRFA